MDWEHLWPWEYDVKVCPTFRAAWPTFQGAELAGSSQGLSGKEDMGNFWSLRENNSSWRWTNGVGKWWPWEMEGRGWAQGSVGLVGRGKGTVFLRLHLRTPEPLHASLVLCNVGPVPSGLSCFRQPCDSDYGAMSLFHEESYQATAGILPQPPHEQSPSALSEYCGVIPSVPVLPWSSFYQHSGRVMVPKGKRIQANPQDGFSMVVPQFSFPIMELCWLRRLLGWKVWEHRAALFR